MGALGLAARPGLGPGLGDVVEASDDVSVSLANLLCLSLAFPPSLASHWSMGIHPFQSVCLTRWPPYLLASWDWLVPSPSRHSGLAYMLAGMLPSPDLYLLLVWNTCLFSPPTILYSVLPASHWPASLWPPVRRDGCVVRVVRPTPALQGRPHLCPGWLFSALRGTPTPFHPRASLL